MKKTALIMAGGRGERFWPRSRKRLPKQFLSLTDDGKTMIQLTVERILPLVEMDSIYIATNRSYKKLVQEQLPGLPEENILCEPAARNTAPCIGLGAAHMERKYGDAVMFVLPSDHLITYPQIFRRTLSEAARTAETGASLVTIGIAPTYPETGYGYIRFRPDEMFGSAYAVDGFVEKPDLDIAREYVQSQQYLWNSGMFTWKVSTILDNLQEYLPEIWEGLRRIQQSIGTEEQEDVLEREFRLFRSVSIDYGVMEKAKNLYILTGSFGWDDVGSWLALDRMQEKLRQGGEALDGRDFKLAKECFEKAMAAADWLEENASLREAAWRAREAAEAAKGEADSVGGPSAGEKAYREGEREWTEAEEAYGEARFRSAAAALSAAGTAYSEVAKAAGDGNGARGAGARGLGGGSRVGGRGAGAGAGPRGGKATEEAGGAKPAAPDFLDGHAGWAVREGNGVGGGWRARQDDASHGGTE